MPRCLNCKDKFKAKYFLQKFCFKDTCIDASIIYAKEYNSKKEVDKRVKKMKVDAKKDSSKSDLQEEINKLSRLIDAKHGHINCIDCDKPMLKQIHGAHFHSVGSNNSLRYNLHNIHSALSQCNRFSDKHHEGYKEGLKQRYGIDYYNYIEYLPLEFKSIKLTALEIREKLKITRQIIRNLHTFKFDSAIDERNYFNKIIGIYN